MAILVHAVERPELKPFRMPDRFRTDVTHFATPAGEANAPASLPSGEFWIQAEDAERIADEGVLRIVSILDSDNRTEIEITEEQEAWLDWLRAHKIQHVRLESVKG